MTEEHAKVLYKLITVDPDSRLDKSSSEVMTLEELRLLVLEMSGQPDLFHVLKVLEEGKPINRTCRTLEELSTAMAELTAGEKGEFFVFRGDLVEVGQQKTVVPLSINTQEILSVSIAKVDPPETTEEEETAPPPEPPAEAAPPA